MNLKSDKKFIYITDLQKDVMDKNLISRLQLPIINLLDYNFDIYDLRNLSDIKNVSDKKIIIDGAALNLNSNKLKLIELMELLKYIKNSKEKYLITHDLHDWSIVNIYNEKI